MRRSFIRYLSLAATAVVVASCHDQSTTAPSRPIALPEQPSFFTYPSAIYRNHVEFGVPADGNSSDDLLLSKLTYYTSHNCTKGEQNWVSWNLNKTHYG